MGIYSSGFIYFVMLEMSVKVPSCMDSSAVTRSPHNFFFFGEDKVRTSLCELTRWLLAVSPSLTTLMVESSSLTPVIVGSEPS